jgi:hypothetical protein
LETLKIPGEFCYHGWKIASVRLEVELFCINLLYLAMESYKHATQTSGDSTLCCELARHMSKVLHALHSQFAQSVCTVPDNPLVLSKAVPKNRRFLGKVVILGDVKAAAISQVCATI